MKKHAIRLSLRALILSSVFIFLCVSSAEAAASKIHYLQGNKYLTQKKLDRAIEQYKKAIGINPNVADYYCKLAQAYQLKGSIGEAIENYEKTLDINPKYYQVCENLGDIYFERGDKGKAVSYYEMYIFKCSRKSERHYFRGKILEIGGKPNEAITEYEEALKNRPEYFEALSRIAMIYVKKRDFEKAAGYYLRAKKLRRFDEETLVNLGIVYTKLKEYKEALKVLHVALKINPFNRDTRFYLGKSFYGTGNMEMAIRQTKKALEIAPDDSEIHFTLGLYYDKKGWSDLAAAEYREALYLEPDYLIDRLERLDIKDDADTKKSEK